MFLFGLIVGLVGGGATIWVSKDKLQSIYTSNENLLANAEAKVTALKATLGVK